MATAKDLRDNKQAVSTETTQVEEFNVPKMSTIQNNKKEFSINDDVTTK